MIFKIEIEDMEVYNLTDLKKRVTTGVVGILLLILIFCIGLNAVKVFILLLTLEAIRELYNAFLKKGIKLFLPILFFGALITFLCTYFNLNLVYALIIYFVVNSVFSIIIEDYSVENYLYTSFSYFYAVFMLNVLASINDIYLIISAFVISFSTDTFAYFVGSTFGKHKLIERISPNKSVEGSIGGTVFALIITSIYFILMNKYITNYNIDFFVILIILISSISGQFGDLFASKLKRYVDTKDYAQILPGHGGVLDRFDSLIFISPFIFILYNII
ncbi:phosphatidate cytidylyltransferase [Peptoniphilus rhinitidis]|uniref:phosphatidate cytidylyltransferase n=1 Tax=Peptoniphilus rhinitidis TaxID=1175452 RepID=UPI0018FE7EBB|nr:phosphatidate cytidylyltransferase [Peptoniphilus rhinitidis]MBS6609981.1 phosphatidate cytidylyltransferase [Peptoniphilus harei]MDU3751325.1 phosphatidate cytidylyltransferase [Peptoniphilus rhinitidis]